MSVADPWRQIMTILLRLISLLLGCALIVVPPYLLRLFASSLGEHLEARTFSSFLAPTLTIGLALGSGPLLIGLPRLVAGSRTPGTRIIAGLLMLVSGAGFLTIGFDGYLTQVFTPAVLLIEAILFTFFIWPAWRFSAGKAYADGRRTD
ncbi:hypothetical protein [Azorhizophilus paspali]|uniref:DUF4345 domain-containing protein n=1 Tax=Azorhizophilus paspali TaxID=69963 RepID=A0ABV6SLG0_AZOPA